MLTCKFYTTAQSNQEKFKLSDYYRKVIKIPEPVRADYAITLFNKVIVNDVRFDTSAVAIDRNNYYTISGKTRNLEKYLNQSLGLTDSNVAGNQLVIFIKKLWLTDKFQQDSTSGNKEDFIPGIYFKIECFYKTESICYPAFKYDASFSYYTKNFIKYAPDLIDSCLKKIVARINSFKNTGIGSLKRQMTFAEVMQYYKRAAEVPILKDSIVNKGIYMTFDDFKKNKPSYTSFDVQKRLLNDFVYVKDVAGKDILLKDLWGYCDGDTLFIKGTQHFCSLKRLGNNFYFVHRSFDVFPQVIQSYNQYLITTRKYLNTLDHKKTDLYQLDMESGERVSVYTITSSSSRFWFEDF